MGKQFLNDVLIPERFVNKSKLSFGGYLVPLSTHYTPVSEAKAATQDSRTDDMNEHRPNNHQQQ